ncbi:helix-turn-helix transcriptional regulator [Clostridium sp. DSM 100503]|uniref:helix-turn-helix domain-containing protein n=1 Tax=Clostridium sp. DSM 100503 TaxID=2963282 RepID=UPI002149FD1A|nr:helix-turn-helix transcriptional regulator [Clostridium sp. DSM 100503]MCR1953148.1 helix-turn-helix transcriptional regulator [Clostridium sp. DSM 100503]
MFNRALILELLEIKGWSQYKLSKRANMAQSTLSDILTGKNSNPRMDTVQKIATALEVSVNDFFDNNVNTENFIPENKPKIQVPKEYSDKYKVTSRDKKQYLEEMKKANEAFFMDDEFNEDSKKEMLDLMSELFWEVKAMNKRKK